jgi:frataxin
MISISTRYFSKLKNLNRIILFSATSPAILATTRVNLSSKNNDNRPPLQQPLFAMNTTATADQATPAQRNHYELASNETLESLTERFDSLVEDDSLDLGTEPDVQYSSGVLTVKLGKTHGTYVLNKQTPNLQIWLSSPVSGPKRFDFIDNTWVYKRTGESLHDLLSSELSKSLGKRVDFSECAFGRRLS